jgi:aspartyl-tRNA(Asn)/glutamyl-tRNA(Gln) amidotransferase subunit B
MNDKEQSLVISIPLNVKSKLFSDTKINLEAKPNLAVGFIDANQPGAICAINFEAIRKAMKLATFLKAKISPILSFDRRLIFSPTHPKGYQITQHHHPLSTGGYLHFKETVVEFEKMILEEAGAEIEKYLGETIINYNRSGRALVKVYFSDPFDSNSMLFDFLDEFKKTLVSHEIYELEDEPITLKIQESNLEYFTKETDLPIILLLKEEHKVF